jgi:hypothetical protein
MDSNLAIKPGSEVEYGDRRFVIMAISAHPLEKFQCV